MSFGRSEIVTLIVIVGVVVSIGVFTFISSSSQSTETSEATRALGDTEVGAPFTDINGNPFSLEQFDGKVRVVNSWATWCPFCITELPDFGLLSSEFSPDEVVVIAINRKEDKARVRAFIDQIGSLGTIIFVQDPNDIFYKSIGGFSMPETVFYDREGNVSFHKHGFMTLKEMREHTNTALSATNK
ncbi:MAG: thiol-disulfide isomerase/thioredoxin [Candidatus Azotimanducaceae bacterium]|jgi:thiol-disulfide isomerase/thioredoxin